MIAVHEQQALRNHSETVARLAERGGLSACEAVAVLEDRPWHSMRRIEAHAQLLKMIANWQVQRPAPTARDV